MQLAKMTCWAGYWPDTVMLLALELAGASARQYFPSLQKTQLEQLAECLYGAQPLGFVFRGGILCPHRRMFVNCITVLLYKFWIIGLLSTSVK